MNNRPSRPPLQLSDIPLPTNITIINNNNNNNNDNITPFQPRRSSSAPSLTPSSSSSSSASSSSLSTFNPAVDALSIGSFTTSFNNGNTTITNYNTPDRHAHHQSTYMHSPINPAFLHHSASALSLSSLPSRPSFLNMLSSPSLSPSILSSVDSLNLNIPGVDLNTAGDRNINNLNLTNDPTLLQSLLESHLSSTVNSILSSNNNNNNNNNNNIKDAQSSYSAPPTPSSSTPSSSLTSSLSISSSTPSSTSPSLQQGKLALYFLHPVPNSNLLTVMKCLQPFPQDILIDSRDISPLPLLGCYYICTMEEKDIHSMFPMSKPIMRWGIYHKITRQLLFSSFYRFNCAFGAKGYFTYDTFLDKGHFGFGQEDIFLQPEDVKEKLWKICLSVLRDRFGVNI